MVYAQGITLSQAKMLLSAAEAKANTDGTLMNIAVVDAGANLVGFSRMDGAFLGSIDIAIKKARTARLFNMPTADLGAIAQPHKELYGIEVSNGGLITFGGGYPIIDSEGRIIGGIGVSGGSVKQDEAVAEEALKAL
jgi:Uncharacterized protein, possibly involved in utilization of glycolate and propanediol